MSDLLVYNGVEYFRRGTKDWIENEVKFLKYGNHVEIKRPIKIDGELCDELEKIYSRPKKLERICNEILL